MSIPVGNNNNEVKSSSDQTNPAVQTRIQFASANLLGDREVVLAAVRNRSSFDDQAEDGRDVQTVAFRHHPNPNDQEPRIQYVSEELKSNREFVLAALSAGQDKAGNL